MSVNLVSAGGPSAGSTTVTPVVDGSTAVGDLVVVTISTKYADPAPPAGWTQVFLDSGSSGASGSDSGTVRLAIYYRVWESGDGNPTFTISGGNSASAMPYTYRRTGGNGWEITHTFARQETPGNPWAVTFPDDLGFRAGSDYLLVAAGWNGDEASPSSPVLTAPGLKVGAVAPNGWATSVGDDVGVWAWGYTVIGGASTGAPSFSAVPSTVTANHPAGLAVLLRIREAHTDDPVRLRATRGYAESSATGTDLPVDLPSGGAIAGGSYLLARVAVDNAGTAGAAPGLTIDDPRGNTWTIAGPATDSAGSPNNGISVYLAYARVTSAYLDGDDLGFEFGLSVASAAVVVEEWSGITYAAPVAVGPTTGNNNATALTLGITPLAVGSLVYAAVGSEGDVDFQTHDSDTAGGYWSTPLRVVTSAATDTQGVPISGGWKVVTGTDAQALTVSSTSRHWGGIIVVLEKAPPSSGVGDLIGSAGDLTVDGAGSSTGTGALAGSPGAIAGTGGAAGISGAGALVGAAGDLSAAGGATGVGAGDLTGSAGHLAGVGVAAASGTAALIGSAGGLAAFAGSSTEGTAHLGGSVGDLTAVGGTPAAQGIGALIGSPGELSAVGTTVATLVDVTVGRLDLFVTIGPEWARYIVGAS